MENQNKIILIDKTVKEEEIGYFENTYNDILKLKEKKQNSNDALEIENIDGILPGLFELILLRTKPQIKYFVRGTPEERRHICAIHKIQLKDCIQDNHENGMMVFQRLSGQQGNIIWLTEQTAELWSFKKLIAFLC